MSIAIYTYSDPYGIDKEQYWTSIMNCPHFCVSQTMVNGLRSVYDQYEEGKLATVQNLIETFFDLWDDKSTYVKQYAFLDQTIKSIELDSEIKRQSLNFNKRKILDSIRLLCELDIEPNKVDTSNLSLEQKILVSIYNEILIRDQKGLFTLKRQFDQNEINQYLQEALKKQHQNNIKSVNNTVDYDTVVFHGIHQFTPIMLRTIENVAKYKRVVLMFNYQSEYKEIYQTWLNVYSWFDLAIKGMNENRELLFSDYEASDSKLLGLRLAKITSGIYEHEIKEKTNLVVTEYDNITEFANYVADKFEYAQKQALKDNQNRSVLAYMNEQFYAANSDVNTILRAYFPEQFGERHFMEFPIGHFFIGVANMWDEENGGMYIDNLEDLEECLCAGILKENTPGQLISIFYKVKEYIYGANSVNEIIALLEKLRKRSKKIKRLNKETQIKQYQKLEYYNIEDNELEALIKALNELNKIANSFYEYFEHDNSFKPFYDEVKNFIEKDVLGTDDLDRQFHDITQRLLQRLENIQDELDVKGSFACLKETMSYYLQQEEKNDKGANWIVRGFEQIDGDILKSKKQSPDRIYHFACLSDANMNDSHEELYPWPLDQKFFETSYLPLDWKYQVFVSSRREHKNFKRYAFIYGLLFNKVKFKLSYIKNADDREHELYYLLRLLNAKIVKNAYEHLDNKRELIDSVIIEGIEQKTFCDMDVYKMRICPYRFELETIMEGGVNYKTHFLLVKYYEILLENNVRVKMQQKTVSEQIVREAVEDESNNLKRMFPFVGYTERMDIETNAKAYLLNEVLNGKMEFPVISEQDKEYMNRKEEFLYLSLSATRYRSENVLEGKFIKVNQDTITQELTEEILHKSQGIKKVNLWCTYCANAEICLEPYKQIVD